MSAEAWEILQLKREQERLKEKRKEQKIQVALRAHKLLQNGFRKLPIDFKQLLEKLKNEDSNSHALP